MLSRRLVSGTVKAATMCVAPATVDQAMPTDVAHLPHCGHHDEGDGLVSRHKTLVCIFRPFFYSFQDKRASNKHRFGAG